MIASSFLAGLAVGVVLKVLVPMPFVDDRVRAGYRWMVSKL